MLGHANRLSVPEAPEEALKYYCAKCIRFYHEIRETKAITPCLEFFVVWTIKWTPYISILCIKVMQTLNYIEVMGKLSALDSGDNEGVFFFFKLEADQKLVLMLNVKSHQLYSLKLNRNRVHFLTLKL